MKQLKKTILTLVALLAMTTGAWAQEVTNIAVGGSTQNNNFVPLPGSLAQNYTKCEFVYPATKLTALNGYDIKKMTFDAKAGSQSWGDARFQVFLKEVDFTTISAYSGTDNATTVYEGVLYLLGTHEMEITFTIPYTYHGGNLLIGVYQTVKGTQGALPQWLGENATGASVRGYNSGSLDAVTTATQCNFLPKVTFTCVSSAPSGPTVDWNKTSKTGTFTMPGGNVELEPEYYPQAALTAQPTAINDVPATTDGAILKAGTVATIGSTEQAQGTVMYYVSPTALDDAALLALAADAWTADVPTAAHLAQGQAYVYYYVRGNDSDTDDETFSDGDILAANALTVTIAAAPTYAVTFAEGTDANEWKAEPATDVKKGQTVTVTYTGSKKVIGVKAEKKEAEPVADIIWDGTNVSDLHVEGDYQSYTKEGIKLSGNAEQVQAEWNNSAYLGTPGMEFITMESGGFTFTAPTGKAFTKIEMKAQGHTGWNNVNLGTGWAFVEDDDNEIYTVTWNGSAASTVKLLKDADMFSGDFISSIAFYLSE